ncbi:MAG: hypothetical protein ACF8XB_14080 [Planctomycetota bacterium JB042]
MLFDYNPKSFRPFRRAPRPPTGPEGSIIDYVLAPIPGQPGAFRIEKVVVKGGPGQDIRDTHNPVRKKPPPFSPSKKK